MLNKIIVGIFGVVIGLTAFGVYQESLSLMNALVVLLIMTIFAFAGRSWDALWNSVKLLQQPWIVAFLFVFAAYYHFSMGGFSFLPTSSFAFGFMLIGFAVGTLVYAYWNIA